MAEKKELTFFEKLTNTLLWSVLFAVMGYVAGILVSKFLYGTGWVFYSPEVVSTAAICFGLLLLFYLLKDRKDDSSFKGQKDMENQHFASIQELNKNFKNCKFSQLKTQDITGVPFRFELKHGDLHIHFTPPCHVLIVGASGTGKTACWVEPTMQILTELKNRPSLFITDPKGEIFAHHSLKMKNQGYTVLQLDLTQPYASKRWNPLENIYEQWQKRKHMEENILKHTNDPIKNYPHLLKAGEINSSEWFEFMGKAFNTLRETLIEVDVEKQKIKDDCFESLQDIAGAIVPSDPDPKNKQWSDGARDYFNACMIAMLEDSENDALDMTKEKYNFFNAYKIAIKMMTMQL